MSRKSDVVKLSSQAEPTQIKPIFLMNSVNSVLEAAQQMADLRETKKCALGFVYIEKAYNSVERGVLLGILQLEFNG